MVGYSVLPRTDVTSVPRIAVQVVSTQYKVIDTILTCIKEVMVKVKVKCPLVQALRLCTGRTAHRGSRGIALLFHDHGTRRG